MALPLIVAGSLSAHVVAYWLAIPETHARGRTLAASGHAYLEHLWPAVGVLAASTVVALTLAAIGRAGVSAQSVGAWPFAVLPPLSFVAQEHLERLVHSGTFPWRAGLELTFIVGLLLQLPFAVLTFFLTRSLLTGIDAVRRAVSRRPAQVWHRPLARSWPRNLISGPRLPALAGGHAERGPPLLSAL